MSAYVCLLIVDGDLGTVVSERWVGGNGVRDQLLQELGRPPDHHRCGFASWGRITIPEASRICEAHYGDGVSPADVEQLAIEFPGDRFWWIFHVDY